MESKEEKLKVSKKKYIDEVAGRLAEKYWNYELGIEQGKKEVIERIERIIKNNQNPEFKEYNKILLKDLKEIREYAL